MRHYEQTVDRVFSLLDVDGSDTLGIEEFVTGLMRVTESSPIQDRHMLIRLDKLATSIANSCGVGEFSAARRASRDQAPQPALFCVAEKHCVR